MHWQTQIDAYIEWLLASGMAATTIRLRTHYVKRLSATVDCGPWEVTAAQIIALLANHTWAPETRKSVRSSMRSFYGWAMDTGQITIDPARSLPRIRVPRGVPKPTPQSVVVKALATAPGRGQLMILLALLAGLRRSEIAQVHTRDLTPDLLGYSLRVTGKGGRVRTVPLHAALTRALLALPEGHVFPGRIDGHLSPGYVGKRLATMLGTGWSGHTLRHRFATEAYAVERDLFAVQRLLGHSKPETTAIYCAIPPDSLRAAVDGQTWAA